MDEQALAIPSVPAARAPSGYYTDAWRRLRRNRWAVLGMAVVGVFAVLAAGAPLLNLPDPITQDLNGRLLSPSHLHWLGTDDLGPDPLSRIIHRGRTSLTAGLVPLRITLAPVIVQTTLGVGSAVLEAAGLSFLGLGAQAPTPEWGAMLTNTREYLRDAPWAATFPGIAILLTVVGCNLLGDGLRDALDPRLRQ